MQARQPGAHGHQHVDYRSGGYSPSLTTIVQPCPMTEPLPPNRRTRNHGPRNAGHRATGHRATGHRATARLIRRPGRRVAEHPGEPAQRGGEAPFRNRPDQAAHQAADRRRQRQLQILRPAELAFRPVPRTSNTRSAHQAAGVPDHAAARRIPLGDHHGVGEAHRPDPVRPVTVAPTPCCRAPGWPRSTRAAGASPRSRPRPAARRPVPAPGRQLPAECSSAQVTGWLPGGMDRSAAPGGRRWPGHPQGSRLSLTVWSVSPSPVRITCRSGPHGPACPA